MQTPNFITTMLVVISVSMNLLASWGEGGNSLAKAIPVLIRRHPARYFQVSQRHTNYPQYIVSGYRYAA